MRNDEFWREAVQAAAARMSGILEATPLIPARSLRADLGIPVYLKAETLQTTGSFKFRPALSSLSADLESARARGVVTSSSGNFAVAVAYVARMFGVRATIVTTPAVSKDKLAKAQSLGGNVVFCEPNYESRQKTVDHIRSSTGALEVHSHSSVETIAGDASCAAEILAALPDVGSVLVPTSGGGFLAGIALGMKLAGSKARVYGVQSTGNDAFVRSFAAREVRTTEKVDTVCDGLVASRPGALGFEVALQHVEGMAALSDGEILAATRRLVRDERLIVEPSGAVGVAALLASSFRDLKPPVVVILSGGNIDLQKLAAWDQSSGSTH